MKMEKPTVEAVRFGSRDVIATSGVVDPFKNLDHNTTYGTLFSEVIQSGMSDGHSPGGYKSFGKLQYDGSHFKQYEADDLDFDWVYTWFHNGQWQTENRTVMNIVENSVPELDASDPAGWRVE